MYAKPRYTVREEELVVKCRIQNFSANGSRYDLAAMYNAAIDVINVSERTTYMHRSYQSILQKASYIWSRHNTECINNDCVYCTVSGTTGLSHSKWGANTRPALKSSFNNVHQPECVRPPLQVLQEQSTGAFHPVEPYALRTDTPPSIAHPFSAVPMHNSVHQLHEFNVRHICERVMRSGTGSLHPAALAVPLTPWNPLDQRLHLRDGTLAQPHHFVRLPCDTHRAVEVDNYTFTAMCEAE